MSTPLAVFESLLSTNGVLQPCKVFAKNTSVLMRQATPFELIGLEDPSRPATILLSVPASELNSDQPQVVDDPALVPVDESRDVVALQTEEPTPQFSFAFDPISGNPSVSFDGFSLAGMTAKSALLTQDEDEDLARDEDISDLLEVVQAITDCPNANGHDIESEVLLEVANLVTPCCWGVLRIYLDKSSMEFSNVLFVHGLLVKHDAQARSYLPIIGDYEASYCFFLASVIVQLLLPLINYSPYNCENGRSILDQLTSTAFWVHQLILASRTDTRATAPFSNDASTALSYRENFWCKTKVPQVLQ